MQEYKKTKVCDPLYNYIYFDSAERELIQHPLFQRLRSIRQLGFVEKAFPSGTHNRYSHSLGVCHLAGEAFDSIFNKNPSLPLRESKKKDFRRALRISALLHDIGHGPLSHSSEALMPSLKNLALNSLLKTDFQRRARHEDYGLKIIMEKEALFDLIKKMGIEPLAVAQILHPELSKSSDFFKSGDLDFLPLLRQIISSDFDVDRMDYLRRDSLFCGVKYGLIDLFWLISHMDCHIEKQKVFLAVRKEGIYNLESLLLGRQYMRLIVYFHNKASIYNQMLKNYIKEAGWRLPANILDYIQWTDSVLFEKLKSDHQNEWAKRIIDNKAYLRLYEETFLDKSEDQTRENLKAGLQQESIDFISINSEEHSIKPRGKSSRYNVYLKNSYLKESIPLNKSPSFMPVPRRKTQRIYVRPDQFSKANALLKNLHRE